MKIYDYDIGTAWYLRDGSEVVITGHDEDSGAYSGVWGPHADHRVAWNVEGRVLGTLDDEEHPRDLYERKRVPVWVVSLGGYAPVSGPYTTLQIRFRSQLDAARFARGYNDRHKDTRPNGSGSFLLAQGPEGQFHQEREGLYNEDRAAEFA